MATTVARLQAVLSADTRDFDRAMGQSDSRMKSVAKTAGKAGLAGAVIGLGFAVKAGFSEFMEAQRVTAQTNAVLKSTAGVANVSADAVGKLSESLMRKSGVDDEVIQSGANVLLTFTKIRNEAGKGNDVFDQATKATLNLSVALGKDMSSSAIMVGKALNDPIKGISSMARAGVQFTEEQKNMVKQLVASGDTLGAQKVILKELETQFGGSAAAAGKTFGGQINIAKERLNNFAGDMVGRAIPHLQAFAGMIQTKVVPWIRGFIDIIRGGGEGGGGLMGALASVRSFIANTWWPTIQAIFGLVRSAFTAVVALFREKEPEIRTIMQGVATVLRGISIVLREVVVPTLRFVFTEVLPRVLGTAIEVIAGLITAIRGVVTFIRETAVPAFRTAFGKVKEPIDEVADAIRAVTDAVKDMIGWLGKIKVPSVDLSKLDPRTWGDPRDPNMILPSGHQATAGGLMGASPVMAPFASMAAAYGLSVTSGLRPGAITANGTPSDHAVGKALDVAGPANGMAAFFMSLLGNRAVKQAFYDPRGSIFGGAWSSYREGGHSDHVHVATYDKGGFLRPGWNLAYNGLGRPEPVGGGNATFHINLGGESIATVVWDQLRNKAQVFERRNGRSAF